MTPAHLFVLHLQPEPGDLDPVRRLKAGLKHLLRANGLRCVAAVDRLGRPIDADEWGSGDPVQQARSLARTFREIAQALSKNNLPPDEADTVAVALASLSDQTAALSDRVYAAQTAIDGPSRPERRPRRRRPPAGR
jgi:hypothetical protein